MINLDKVARNHLARCGVPPEFLDAQMKDFSKNMQQLPSSSYLYGDRGAGKSRLMCALMRSEIDAALKNVKDWDDLDRRLAYKVPSMRFVTAVQLISAIKSTYDANATMSESSIVRQYTTDIDWLLLDDIGVERPTAYVLETLTHIINYHTSNLKRLTVSSNYTIEELTKRLDDRIASRLNGRCTLVAVNDSDRRLKR